MRQNTPKFRLKLNLFDTIVLVLALAVGGVLAFIALKPAAPVDDPAAAAASTVRYVVRFNRMLEGTEKLVEPGDILIDNIKNYNIGTVVSTEVRPHLVRVVDQQERRVGTDELEGYVDLYVTVECDSAVIGEREIVLGGGYTLRGNTTAYIRGEGYMASGPIISIQREGQA